MDRVEKPKRKKSEETTDYIDLHVERWVNDMYDKMEAYYNSVLNGVVGEIEENTSDGADCCIRERYIHVGKVKQIINKARGNYGRD